MSTKKIREAMAAMRSCIKSGEPWTPKMEEVRDAALAELEAIERAAKDAYQGDVTHRLTATDSGLELGLLLENIAKETP